MVIEMAIVFPVFIMILFAFVWRMSVTRNELVFKSILIKEVEKCSFLGVIGSYTPEIYEKITGKAANIDLSDAIINEIYEINLKNQIKEHFEQMRRNNPSFQSLISKHEEYFECGVLNNTLQLTSQYTLFTPFGEIKKVFFLPLRLWDYGDHSGKVSLSDKSSIWDMDNFNRGKVLRRRFGGNLPFGFPTLSGYQNGNAMIIKSMDLNCKTWSDPFIMKNEILMNIREIANYKGMNTPWGETGIVIRPEDIVNRFVKIIIPENYDSDKFNSVMQEALEISDSLEVQTEFFPYQKSIKS